MSSASWMLHWGKSSLSYLEQSQKMGEVYILLRLQGLSFLSPESFRGQNRKITLVISIFFCSQILLILWHWKGKTWARKERNWDLSSVHIGIELGVPPHPAQTLFSLATEPREGPLAELGHDKEPYLYPTGRSLFGSAWPMFHACPWVFEELQLCCQKNQKRNQGSLPNCYA